MNQDPHSTQASTAATDSGDISTQGAYVTGGAEFNRDTNYIEDRSPATVVRAPTASRAGAPKPAATG